MKCRHISSFNAILISWDWVFVYEMIDESLSWTLEKKKHIFIFYAMSICFDH